MSKLGWLLQDDLPLLSTVDSRPWADVPDDLVPQVTKVLRPLVRALLLAGHRPYKVDFVRSTGDPQVVTLTAGGLTAGTEATLGAPMPSTGSGVVLTVADLVHDRALQVANAGGWHDPQAGDAGDLSAVFSHALHVPATAQAPWTGLEPGIGGQVVLWSGDALTAQEEGEQVKLNRPWIDEIARCVGEIADDIRDALKERLSQGQVTPLSRAGLLWLFNPIFWYLNDVAFPGEAFDAAMVSEPSPLDWPAVTTAAAQDLDPVALQKADPPPDKHVSLMVAQAGLLVPILADAGFKHIVLGRLIFGRTFEYVDHGRTVFGWNSGRDGDLASLLKASPASADAPTRGRLLVSAVRALAGKDFANAMFFGKPNWLEVLMDLAELGVLAPAGYPVEFLPSGGQMADLSDVDPVVPMYFAATDTTREMIVLEVAGAPAVTIAATSLCEVPLMQAFAWDYLTDNPPDRLLTLMVVAGPGVQVIPGVARGLRWELEVLRVWNYSAVPPRGARIQPELLLAPFPLTWQPTAAEPGRYPDGLPLYGLQVFPLPQGVALEYPIPAKEGDTPQWRLTATAPEGSNQSRIAYDITFGHDQSAVTDFEPGDTDPGFLDEPSAAAVTLWVSPEVTVGLEWLQGDHSAAPAGMVQAWRIADPAEIPLQGACLPYQGIVLEANLGPPLPVPVTRPDSATKLTFPPDQHTDTYTELLRFMVDFGIGFIPVVGDLVDIMELTVSLYTGKDKWGRPMSQFEQLFMAACILVPGVSNGAAKLFAKDAEQMVSGMGYALELSRHQNQPLLEVVTALRGGLPADIERRLDDLVGIIPEATLPRLSTQRQQVLDALRVGIAQNLDAAQRVGAAITPELAEEAPRFLLVDLLTDVVPTTQLVPGRQFWLPSLREPFERWCRARNRFPDENAVRDWVISQADGAQGVERAMLQALLGPDVLNRAILQGARPPVRSPRVGNWGCLAPVYFRGGSTIGAAEYARTGLDPVVALARWLVTESERLAAQGLSSMSSDGRLLEFTTPQQMTVVADRVETLLRNLSPTRPLRPSTAELTDLLLGGNRRIDPGDMAEVLMRGMHQVGLLFDRMGQATNLVAHLTVEEFLQITGHQSVFKNLLTGSSYQESALFEVEVFSEEFARQLGPGQLIPLVPTSVARNNILLQPRFYDGQSGADIIRRMDGMAQIVEVKLWQRVYKLFDPGGRSLNQIHRFAQGAADGHVYRFPDGSGLLTHPDIIVRADWREFHRMCQRRQTEAQSRAMVQAMAQQFEDQANFELADRGLQMRVIVELDPLYIAWNR